MHSGNNRVNTYRNPLATSDSGFLTIICSYLTFPLSASFEGLLLGLRNTAAWDRATYTITPCAVKVLYDEFWLPAQENWFGVPAALGSLFRD